MTTPATNIQVPLWNNLEGPVHQRYKSQSEATKALLGRCNRLNDLSIPESVDLLRTIYFSLSALNEGKRECPEATPQYTKFITALKGKQIEIWKALNQEVEETSSRLSTSDKGLEQIRAHLVGQVIGLPKDASLQKIDELLEDFRVLILKDTRAEITKHMDCLEQVQREKWNALEQLTTKQFVEQLGFAFVEIDPSEVSEKPQPKSYLSSLITSVVAIFQTSVTMAAGAAQTVTQIVSG